MNNYSIKSITKIIINNILLIIILALLFGWPVGCWLNRLSHSFTTLLIDKNKLFLTISSVTNFLTK